jgi:hypothetical protein
MIQSSWKELDLVKSDYNSQEEYEEYMVLLM